MGQEDNKGRCNHDAIGSLVELRSGGWYQAQVVDSPTVHFGLGDHKQAEQVRIVWTNGVPQDLVEIGGNVAICERMTLKGSCPYIYTHGGRPVPLLHGLPVGCTSRAAVGRGRRGADPRLGIPADSR